MTVRIGTGSSAVDPSALRVAGVAPSKIMLGTGSAAVQVWSASAYPASGTWGPFSIDAYPYPYPVLLTHTVSESGNFTFTITSTPDLDAIYYNLNGAYATTPGGNTWTANLVQGDTIVVDVDTKVAATYYGTWSIVKN